MESFGRGLLRALQTQFRSPQEALRELIDNAVDHSQGQHVYIDIQVAPNLLVIENIGGRGMGDQDLAEYVTWGAERPRDGTSIGHYGQGGKAAIAYLGDCYKLWCRRSGDPHTYLLEDHQLLASTEPRDYGEITPLPFDVIPESLLATTKKQGCVRIEIRQLNPTLDLDEDKIRRDISAVYGRLLRRDRLTITLNDAPVQPRDIVLDHSVPPASIAVQREGLTVTGYVGKLAREANKGNQPKPGLALIWRGRRIEEGQWFSASPFAKGSLAAFYGELEIEGWLPNLNKTAFRESASQSWIEVGEEIMRQAKPVLDALRSSSDSTTVTARDRRVAKEVRREIAEVMTQLLGLRPVEEEIEEERKVRRSQDGPQRERVPTRKGRGPTTAKSVTDDDQSTTVKKQRLVPDVPDIVVSVWDAPVRSETREENGALTIHVNKAHPAFSAANARFAVAEAAILELLRVGGGLEEIDDYLTHVDQALAAWAQLAEEGDD